MADTPRAGLREALSNSGFFVLRTPLLPIEEALAWGEGLTLAACGDSTPDALENAWRADLRLLRSRLRALLERPEIFQALHVASTTLQSGIHHWRRDPDSKKGIQAERSIVRYFQRMCTRPTPFGLFSGCSVGSITASGEQTTLVLQPRDCYRTSSRLDFDYLFALCGALRRDDALALELRYWPNSSLRRIADAWHYTESRLRGAVRSRHLVRLEEDSFLAAAIHRASMGPTIADVAQAGMARDPD